MPRHRAAERWRQGGNEPRRLPPAPPLLPRSPSAQPPRLRPSPWLPPSLSQARRADSGCHARLDDHASGGELDMCGIAGWIDWARDLSGERPILQRMADTLACRGPDAEGLWLSQRAAFVHRRLAVIDIE